jgi:hypothetical protein
MPISEARSLGNGREAATVAPGNKFSGHSLRSGFLTSAARRGASESDVSHGPCGLGEDRSFAHLGRADRSPDAAKKRWAWL